MTDNPFKSRSKQDLGANSPERFGRRPDPNAQAAQKPAGAAAAAHKIIENLGKKKK